MKKFLLTLLFICLSCPAFADVKLSDVHSFETAPSINIGVLLMTIENQGDKTDRLIDVSTPVADSAQIHLTTEENDVMKMRKVGALPIEAGKTVKLDSVGYHIMLMGLKDQLVAGRAFPVKLKFERGGEILTTVRVRSNEPVSHEGMEMPHMDMKH